MDARFDQIFREEARRAMGERMTAERLIQTIVEFPATATPQEVGLLAAFISGVASRLPAPEATAEAVEPVASPPPVAVPVAAQRPSPAPFRVSYPAPARPRAVEPPPEPDPDDIEDFTAAAT